MPKLISPSGREYEWTKDTPPTEEDMRQLQEYDASLGKQTSWADKKAAEENAPQPEAPPQTALSDMMLSLAGGTPFGINPVEAAKDPAATARGAAPALGLAASVIAPEAMLAAAPGLAPAAAAGPVGYLLRSAALNAASGGAGAATEEALNSMGGDTSGAVGRVAKAAGAAAALAPLNPLIEKGIGAVAGAAGGAVARAAEAWSAKSLMPLLKGAAKGGAAGMLRPLYLTDAEQKVSAARKAIEDVTGVAPPASLGEALGKTAFGGSFARIEKELGGEAAGALSDEARNAVTQSVLFNAAELMGTGATREDVAKLVMAGLRKEVGAVSAPVEKLVNDITDEVVNATNAKLGAVGGEAEALITPASRVTKDEAGSEVKAAALAIQDKFNEIERANFDAARGVIGDAKTFGMANANKALDEVEKTALVGKKKTESVVYDQYGNPAQSVSETEAPIPRTLNEKVRGILSEIRAAKDTQQGIENLRQYRSELRKEIDYSGEAGRGDHLLKKVVKGISDDIEEGISAIQNPQAKQLLDEANKFTRENVDEVFGKFMSKVAKSPNEGGSKPESVISSLASASSEYRAMRSAFRRIDPRAFVDVKSNLKNAILSDIAKPGSAAVNLDGTVNAAGAFKELSKLPEEIRADLGIDVERLRNLALSDEALSGILKGATGVKGNKEKALEWISLNESELAGVMGPGGDQKFKDLARAKLAESELYRNGVISDLAQRDAAKVAENPEKFVSSIFNRKFDTSHVKDAMDILARQDPRAAEQLQADFLAELLERSQVKGIVGGKKLDALLSAPASGMPAGSGVELGTSKAILGDKKVNALRDVARNLDVVQGSLMDALKFQGAGSTAFDDALYGLASKSGVTGSLRVVYDAVGLAGKARYKAYAKLLNDDKSRALLMKPIERLTQGESAALVGAMANASTR